VSARFDNWADPRWDVPRFGILFLAGAAGDLLAVPPPTPGLQWVLWGLVALALVLVLAGRQAAGCLAVLVIVGIYLTTMVWSQAATGVAGGAALAAVLVSEHLLKHWRLRLQAADDRAWLAAIAGGQGTAMAPERQLACMARFFARQGAGPGGQSEHLEAAILAGVAWLAAHREAVPGRRARYLLDLMRGALQRSTAAPPSTPPLSAAVQAVSRLQMTLDEGLVEPFPDEEGESGVTGPRPSSPI
jgi:hypothetical protein